MAIETVNQTVGDAMVIIANKLGIALTDIFHIYTQVQYGFAIMDILSYTLPVIIFIILAYLAYREMGKSGEQNKIRKDLENTIDYGKYQASSNEEAAAKHYELKQKLNEARSLENTIDGRMAVRCIAMIVVPILVYLAVIMIGTAVLKIYAPEYFAIQTMIHQFGNVVPG